MTDEFELKGKVRIDSSELDRLPERSAAAMKKAAAATNRIALYKPSKANPAALWKQIFNEKLAREAADKAIRSLGKTGNIMTMGGKAQVQGTPTPPRFTSYDAKKIEAAEKLRQRYERWLQPQVRGMTQRIRRGQKNYNWDDPMSSRNRYISERLAGPARPWPADYVNNFAKKQKIEESRVKGPPKTEEQIAEAKAKKAAYEKEWHAKRKLQEAGYREEIGTAPKVAKAKASAAVRAEQISQRPETLDRQIADKAKLRKQALIEAAARREEDLKSQIAAAKGPEIPDRPILKSNLTTTTADRVVASGARQANVKYFATRDPNYQEESKARNKRIRGQAGPPTPAAVAADPEKALKNEYVRQWRAASKAGIQAETRSEVAARLGIKAAEKKITAAKVEAAAIPTPLRPEQRAGFDRINTIAGISRSGKYKTYPPEFERREPELGGNRVQMGEDVGGPKGPYQPEITVQDKAGKQLYDGPDRRAIGKPTIGGRGFTPDQLKALEKKITPEGILSPDFVDPRLAAAKIPSIAEARIKKHVSAGVPDVIDQMHQLGMGVGPADIAQAKVALAEVARMNEEDAGNLTRAAKTRLSTSANDEETAKDVAKENKKRGIKQRNIAAAQTRTSNRVLSMEPHDVYMREWNAAKKAGLPRPTRTEVFARMGATTPTQAARAATPAAPRTTVRAVTGPLTRAIAGAASPSPAVIAAVTAATTTTAATIATTAGAAVVKAAKSPRVRSVAAPAGLMARMAALGSPTAMLAMAGMGPGGRVPAGGGGAGGGGGRGGGRARGYVPPPPPPHRPFGARPTAVGGASSSFAAGAFRGIATAISAGTGIGVPFLSLSPTFIAASVAASAFIVAMKTALAATKELADGIVKLRQVSGGSLTSTSRLAATTRAFGVDLNTTTDAATEINKRVLEGSSVFERFGIKTTDASGRLRTSESIIYDAQKAISALRTPTQQAAAAQDFFGSSGQEMLKYLRQSPAALAAQTTAIESQTKAGVAATQAEEARVRLGSPVNNWASSLADTVGTSLVKAQNSIQDFFNNAGKEAEANNARVAAMRKAQLAGLGKDEVAEAGRVAEAVVRERQKASVIVQPADIGVSGLQTSITLLGQFASAAVDANSTFSSLKQSILGFGQARIQMAFAYATAEKEIANNIFDQEQNLANEAENRAMVRAEQIAALTISLNEFRASEFSAMVRAREAEKSFFAFRPDNALARANEERRYQRDRAQEIARDARTNALADRQLENQRQINAFETANMDRQEKIVAAQLLIQGFVQGSSVRDYSTALINLQTEVLRQAGQGKHVVLDILLNSPDFTAEEQARIKAIILQSVGEAAAEALGVVRSGALRIPMPGRIGGPQD